MKLCRLLVGRLDVHAPSQDLPPCEVHLHSASPAREGPGLGELARLRGEVEGSAREWRAGIRWSADDVRKLRLRLKLK